MKSAICSAIETGHHVTVNYLYCKPAIDTDKYEIPFSLNPDGRFSSYWIIQIDPITPVSKSYVKL